jgi:hypothetical protein
LPSAGNRNNSDGSLNNQGSNGIVWSSSVTGSNSQNLNFDSGNANTNSDNRADGLSVRCLSDYKKGVALDLFSLSQQESDKALLVALFKAYKDARKNKRAKKSQLLFEYEYERKLIKLHKQIINRTYKPLRSSAFISTKPVIREVFAAHFQDRVVHHLIYNHINPIFEKEFIEDSYSCRKGKGTLYGVNRVFDFIQNSSENYTKDAYILKLDIQGYFYSIDKHILYDRVKSTLLQNRELLKLNFEDIDYLIRETIFTDPTKNVYIHQDEENWNKLPKNKSLFFAKKDCGLPIGNLTSQLFSNIYMDKLDKFITQDLMIEYYGRYVDDFILIHNDKKYLLSLISKIRTFLSDTLHLTLHPKKIYFQHFSKGVKFLGAYMKPYVKYIDKRTKNNFYTLIQKINNEFIDNSSSDAYLKEIRNSINSYLGTMIHFSSYRLRSKILSELQPHFFNYFLTDEKLSKVVLKEYYY